MKQKISSVWFAAEYGFAATYSIREPGTSLAFAKACPVPGPGTVKLALVKVSIELYGQDFTRLKLFPAICDMDIVARPPLRLGISRQLLQAFKHSSNEDVRTSISHREHIQPSGNLVIYTKCDEENADLIRPLFQLIGYWGQRDSLAYCLSVQDRKPVQEECITRLENIIPNGLKGYQMSFLTDIDRNAGWNNVMLGTGILLFLYVLPLILVEEKANSKILKYEKLPSNIFANRNDKILSHTATRLD